MKVGPATIAIALMVIVMSIIPAGAASVPLRPGDRLPDLEGHTLSGRSASLPQSARGKVTLVAIGFTYESRDPVEAWSDWFRSSIDPAMHVAFFEVPMISGMATLGRWFIDRGMRKGTPPALHEQVITVYQGAADWKSRLAYSADRKDDAYLIVFDGSGIVRWLYHGRFDASAAAELKTLLVSTGRLTSE
jgi:hypothetical protein